MMLTKDESLLKEFTLPFVGREEELHFLLHEYDQMLHAQYRSVWIEAPAGMGKTTLVEEFLKRIHNEEPRPLIVHAKLRERSANALRSIAEAVGVEFKLLTDTQRSQVLRKLTSFYRERAERLLSPEGLKLMSADETLTTSGYLLRQMAMIVPVVVVLEDLHVVPNESAVDALRHLLAVIEHTPMLTMLVSRPTSSPSLRNLRHQLVSERCDLLELQPLVENEVSLLTNESLSSIQRQQLLRQSGGNPLLLGYLLRSGVREVKQNGTHGTTDEIIAFFYKELHHLPKKDRQVIALAGVFGEEFSEDLLEAVARQFHCWTTGVIERLQGLSIIAHFRKELTGKEGVHTTVRMTHFSHALWWEAARKLFDSERRAAKWSERSIAKMIVPLIVERDVPPLSDAHMLAMLLRNVSHRYVLQLLNYVHGFCGETNLRWYVHSSDELILILSEARVRIRMISAQRGKRLMKEDIYKMVDILGYDSVLASRRVDTLPIYQKNMVMKRKLIGRVLDDEGILALTDQIRTEATLYWTHFADLKHIHWGIRHINKLIPKISPQHQNLRQVIVYAIIPRLEGLRFFYTDIQRAAKYFLNSTIVTDRLNQRDFIALIQTNIVSLLALPLPLEDVHNIFKFFERRWNTWTRLAQSDLSKLRLCMARLALYIRCGKISEGYVIIEETEHLLQGAWHHNQRFSLESGFLKLYAYACELEQCRLVDVIPETDELWRDAAFVMRERGKVLFYTEQWEEFDKLWYRSKEKLLHSFLRDSLVVIEQRILMDILLGSDVGKSFQFLTKMKKKFPLMKTAITRVEKRLQLFLALRAGVTKECIARFEKYLREDHVRSNFDKAFDMQFFARCAMTYGHSLKLFTSLVERSLDDFARLNLPKRVLFTAERFHECGLLTDREYDAILKKYDKVSKKNSKIETVVIEDKNDKEGQVEETSEEIRLQCFGRIAAYSSNGKEIVGEFWGKRKKEISHHKRIMIALVCAKYEGRVATRRELLSLFYPKIEWSRLSKKRREEYELWLSIRLSQLRKVFQPAVVLKRTDGGYKLSENVHVDLFDITKAVDRGKALRCQHLPSAQHVCYSSLRAIGRGQFAGGIRDARVQKIRRRIVDVRVELEAIAKECRYTLKGK